jgi:L-lactate dehydrogenase complex protein LldG
MTARDSILASVQKNHPSARALPAVPHFRSEIPAGLKERFAAALKQMAGETVAECPADFGQFISARFPLAKKICSAVMEVPGNCRPADFANWAEPATIDVTVIRAPLGVAETGSVLLSESEFVVNTVGLLAQDLVVLLDPEDIVENIHDAYQHRYFRESGYCVLMTGPSGSGDIGAVVVHPAQASKTLTVVFAHRSK